MTRLINLVVLSLVILLITVSLLAFAGAATGGGPGPARADRPVSHSDCELHREHCARVVSDRLRREPVFLRRTSGTEHEDRPGRDLWPYYRRVRPIPSAYEAGTRLEFVRGGS